MAFINFRIEGIEKAIDRIGRNGIKRASEQMIKATLNLAIEIENKAKAHSPRDTGELASSITHTRTPQIVGTKIIFKVGTNLWYAPFIEFGTGRRGAASSGLVSRVPQAEQARQAMSYIWGAGKERPYVGMDGTVPMRGLALPYQGPRADPEEGQPARPFLFPAYHEAIVGFPAKLAKIIEEAIRGGSAS